ncbi:oxygen-dependent protoporphyrinogen oxidase [Evansella vedderi]|uniref:Coproporphyrinogen III oxidase n=1 Tax=Evansella vedderi TaxID=38282 RepID=A0ABT9ZSN2_9BACI|nr:protoporphyrinogen oxidase [Evansella vedderi]MDQ0254233.1 oxygen-dependent protoporphyrinogen oxidase [Evansella vedderi]
MSKKRIAIVGGGITGLSAAFYLQKEVKEKKLKAEIMLYESSSRLGGNIQTDYSNGFVSELGPDSYLARKNSMTQLIKDVGLGEDLVYNSSGKSYILHEGSLYPMPGGAIMGIPTQWGPFLGTKLFSLSGKARAAGDLFLPRAIKNGKDISLGHFFRKRLGNEVVDRLIDPLLSGIYAGDLDRISLRATFPHFEQMEKKYRSMIVGMKSSIAKQQSVAPSRGPGKGKPKGMFLSLKRGLQSLVDAVENSLGESIVKKNARLLKIQKHDKQYMLRFEDGRTDIVDYLILTTPHKISYDLLRDYSAVQYLKEIPATSVATIVLAFPKSAVKKDIDGTGFVVSKKTSDYSITACTWTHKKWMHSTPEGYVSLRGYVGRFGEDDIVHKSDEEILSLVMKDLNQIMEIEGEPEHFRITRWKETMPQYEVGHVERIKELNEGLHRELPGLFITGASFEGIGLPDCIDQGKKTAFNIVDQLTSYSMEAGD